MFGFKLVKDKEWKELSEGYKSVTQAMQDVLGVRIVGGAAIERLTTGADRQAMVEASRRAFRYSPLGYLPISLTTWFALGMGGIIIDGLEPREDTPENTRPSEEAQLAFLKRFWNDGVNQAVFSGYTAQEQLACKLQVDGDLFILVNSDSARTKFAARVVDVSEIEEIICDPNDPVIELFYKRSFTPYHYNFGSGTSAGGAYLVRGYHQATGAIDWQPTDKFTGPSKEDLLPGFIHHVTFGSDPTDHWGWPALARAIDWINAHKSMAGDLRTVIRALSAFLQDITVRPGRVSDVARIHNLRDTLIGRLKRAPVVGSELIHGPQIEIKQPTVQTGAADITSRGLKDMVLMVCAATGIPFHYFGDPSCYSADTEVLTEHGFMLHSDWRPGIKIAAFNPATEAIEFLQPQALFVAEYKGKLIHFHNAQTDILVTPDHRMFTAPFVNWEPLPKEGERPKGKPGRRRLADGGPVMVPREWRIEPAKHLLDNPRAHGWRFKARADYPGQDVDVLDTPLGYVAADAWCRFIGYFLSEGWVLNRSAYEEHGIFISQREGLIADKIRATLRDLGLSWKETSNQYGVKMFGVHHEALWAYLKDNCGVGAANKRIPPELMNLSVRLKKVLYAALMDGDGGPSGKAYRYSTVSKRLADDMQLLAMAIGYAASVTSEEPEYGQRIYRVWIRSKILESRIRPHNVSEEEYDGLVYCFHVDPHQIYITRRNGKIAIQGNTGNLATARSMELPIIKKVRSFQAVIKGLYEAVLNFVLRAKFGPYASTVKLSFPPMLERNVAEYITAIVQAYQSGLLEPDNAMQMVENILETRV